MVAYLVLSDQPVAFFVHGENQRVSSRSPLQELYMNLYFDFRSAVVAGQGRVARLIPGSALLFMVVCLMSASLPASGAFAEVCVSSTVKKWKVRMHLTQTLNKTGVLQSGPDCTANYTLALNHVSDVVGEFSNDGTSSLWQGNLTSAENVNDKMDIQFSGRPECSIGDNHFIEVGAGEGTEENVSLTIDPASGKYIIAFPHTGVEIPTVYSAPGIPVYQEGVLHKEINGDFLIDYPGMVLATSSTDPVTTLELPLSGDSSKPIVGETSFPHHKYPEITITWSWELIPDRGTAERELGSPDGHGQASGGEFSPGSGYGAPTWSVNMVNLNVFIADSPLWYHNPIGPSVQLNLSYNSNSGGARFEPVGRKWQLNYESYLSADEISGDVTIYMPDGRIDTYTPTSTGFTSPYRVYNELKVTRQGEIMEGSDYELKFPDGTIYLYKVPPGSLLWAFLAEIRDPHGNRLSLDWEGQSPWGGKLRKISDALGRSTTFFYDAENRVSSVSDPFGRLAQFAYSSQGDLQKITDMGGYFTSFTYDACGNMVNMAHGQNTWTFEPDATGLTVRDNLGSERFSLNADRTGASYQGPNAQAGEVSSYVLEPAKDGSDHTDVTAFKTPEGADYSYTYDARGNLATQTMKASTGNETSTLTYNAKGKVTSVRDPRGAVTTLTYAANNVDLLKLQDGLGSVSATYNSTHDILTLTDRMGASKSFVYNTFGQVTQTIDALGVTTNYIYNSSHQLIRIERNGVVVGSYQYDGIGRVSAYTDINGYTRQYAYNNVDDLLSVTYPDGNTTIYSRSKLTPHLADSVTDQAGRVMKHEYNARRQLWKLTDPEGGETRFSYDSAGHMQSLVDPKGNTTLFAYDKDNRLLWKQYADGSRMLFSYADGRLKSAKNARGITTTYTYDKSGNLATVRYSDSTPGITNTYDAYNRPTRIDDALGTHLITYDASSRITSVDGPWGNDTLTIGYDIRGRKTSLVLQTGPSMTYSYDFLDRLKSVTGNGHTYAYSYHGNTMLLTKVERSAAGLTEYAYDTVMKRLQHLTNRNRSGSILDEYVMVFDSVGQPTGMTVTNGPALQFPGASDNMYTYNNLNQAVTLNGGASVFAYDLDGNMVRGQTGDGQPFDAAYDAENRLKSLQYTDRSGIVRRYEYLYGADGFMGVEKTYANGVLNADRRFIWHMGKLFQERNAANVADRSYIWGLGQLGGVGDLLGLIQGNTTYHYFSNPRGDITAALDSNGAVAAMYAYDPFGGLLAATGVLQQPIRFATRRFDESTGLYYFGHRFYSPAIGRWLSRDPLAEMASINLYSYAANNPTTRIDPFGAADFSGLSPEHRAQAQAMYDAMRAKQEAEVSVVEKVNRGLGAAFKWLGDKLREHPEATKAVTDTVVDKALDANKYTKAGKEWNERINKGFEIAEDIAEIKAAYHDKDPASGLTMLKKIPKNTIGRVPGIGKPMSEVLTKGIETVETAPGGVKAMRNVGARADEAYRAGR